MDLTAVEALAPAPTGATVRKCWVPGRVTLLGEHLDYNGLPVLAMPVDRGLNVSWAPAEDDGLTLRSADPAFAPASFRHPAKTAPEIDGWGRYVALAAAQLRQKLRCKQARGFHLQVQGDLPPAAGLASSSALTVAAGLAWLSVQGLALDRDVERAELAEWLAEAERGVGTEGGCMDHATLLLGTPGCASKIDFIPLRAEPVPLPDGYCVVVSHSLVHADKGGAEQERYNEGPRIGKILCALIERKLQEEFEDPDLELECIGDLWFGPLCMTLAEVEALCDRAIERERYSPREIRDRLGDSRPDLSRLISQMQAPAGGFPLRARLRHQISEFRRVEAGRDALLIGDVEQFGALMNASHTSCAEDCGVSCPELDTLTALAREAGALGSRLTGAGFGGATVSLVREADIAGFQAALASSYYAGRLESGAGLPVFPVRPGESARYL
ncbi:MAG: hypothetical protein IT368_12485 [Candidatus Hydrogenedentes bacterium]|nr:hypothetical protein [Candidatus Hydrogenedentota bacterium]